jgi:hypothetical protein
VLDFAEAALDTLALFVEFAVVFALHFAVAFGRNDGLRAHLLHVRYVGLGIVGLVCQYGRGPVCAQQFDSLSAVVSLATGETKIDRMPDSSGSNESGSSSLLERPSLEPCRSPFFGRGRQLVSPDDGRIQHQIVVFLSFTNSRKTRCHRQDAAQRMNRFCTLLYLP